MYLKTKRTTQSNKESTYFDCQIHKFHQGQGRERGRGPTRETGQTKRALNSHDSSFGPLLKQAVGIVPVKLRLDKSTICELQVSKPQVCRGWFLQLSMQGAVMLHTTSHTTGVAGSESTFRYMSHAPGQLLSLLSVPHSPSPSHNSPTSTELHFGRSGSTGHSSQQRGSTGEHPNSTNALAR